MDREQWLRERMQGIGGSDAAAVLGLSKWKTPYALYLEKRGEAPASDDSEPMRWGRLLEPVVRQEYAERSGEVVRLPTEMLRHARYPWMLATVDGITDTGRLVELKTARSAEDWGEPGTDEIPQAYLIQVQHYLEVTELEVADVAVLIGGQDFRQYEVEADAELQDMIVEAEAQFWDRVQRADPPDPVTLSDVMAKYGRASRPGAVIATAEVAQAVAALAAVRTEKGALDEVDEQLRARILGAFGNLDTLVDVDGQVLATWKAARPSQVIDWKAIAGQLAPPQALIDQFTTEKPGTRRLLLLK